MSRSREGFTGVDTQGGSGSLASVKQTITFFDSNSDGKITIQEAIDQINSKASITKVKASLIDGHFTLTQIDALNQEDSSRYNTQGGANSSGEGDTINFSLSGSGDFAFISGFGSYSVSGQSDTGSMSNQAKSVLTGSTSVSASDQFLNSSITITGLTSDNTSISKTISLSGNLNNAISQINSSGLGITASIQNSKFTLTSNFFSELGISVSGNSDFLRVSGLGSFSISSSSSSSASGSDLGFHYHGVSTSYAKTDGNIAGGALSIGGHSFSVTGKTVEQVVSDINSSGVAIAQLFSDGKLIIQVSKENTSADSIKASGDAARVLGLADYSTSSGSSVAGTGSDLGFHYHGVSTSSVLSGGYIKSGSLSIQGKDISVIGKSLADIVNNINSSGVAIAQLQNSQLVIQSLAEGSLNISASGDAARVLGLASYSNGSASSSAGSYFNHWNYSYDVWSKKYDGWDTSLDYSGYDSHSYDTSNEVNYTTYTTGTIWDSNFTTHTTGTNYTYWNKYDPYISGYNTSVETNSSITGYGTTTQKTDGHWSYGKTTSSVAGYYSYWTTSSYVETISGSESSMNAANNAMNNTWASYNKKNGKTTYIADTHEVSGSGNHYNWTLSVYAQFQTSSWVDGYNTTITTSTWVDGIDTTRTTATYWGTNYTTHTTGTNWATRTTYSYYSSISSYNYSTETNYWIDYYLTSTDTNWTTWYYETYWTKDYSTSYNTDVKDGYYDAPGFKYSNNSSTQYRNISSTHIDDTSSYSLRSRIAKPSGAGTITSGASNNSATNSAFAGQIAGTVTVKSSRYGNIASISYSATESVDSILNKLKALTVKGNDGKSHSVFYDLDSTGGYTDGYFGAVSLDDSGNALKLLGLATQGASRNSTKVDSSNSDYNGIIKSSASLTSSLGGFSSSSVRPFQGSGSFYVYVGNHVAGKVNYSSSSTVGDIINQINNMSYVYDSGVSVSSPFTNNLAQNDDNSFITGKLEDGSSNNAYVQNGKIYYTAQLQAFLDSSGHIVIKSDVYDKSPQSVSVKNDTASFCALSGLDSSAHNYSSNSSLKYGDEGIYTYTGASVPGLQASSNLTFVGGQNQGFYVTIDDGNRNDTLNTVDLKQYKFFVNVYENDTVQNILDRMTQLAKSNGIGLNFSAKVQNNKIIITTDGKFGEAISFSNDSSGFIQRAGLSTTSKTYAENKNSVIESYGYDRLTGSVNTISKSHVLGNLSSESFTISGSNGSYNISVQSGWSVQKIIDEIFSQSNGHYKAGIFNPSQNDYDNASVGQFYIESTTQSPIDTTVSSTDLTRRLGLVSVNQSTGPSSQTATGDHGFFTYTSDNISGLKPNSIISGLKNGQLSFTLHQNSATGQTGSVTYRPTSTYTIDIVYNDTASSILNKMKQAILKKEDDSLEHSDITGDNRLDRLDFKVVYDSASNQGHLSLQIIGNYASSITFDSDSSGFSQALGLDKLSHSYSSNYSSVSLSSGKSMLTGSVSQLNYNHIFANMKQGSLSISAGSVSKTIDIKSTDRIQDVIDKINQGNIFFADLDSQGRLFIKTIGQNNSKISLSGNSDFAQLTGLSQGLWNYSASQDLGNKNYSKLTGSVYGLSTSQTFNNMSSGSFSVSAQGLSSVNINVTKGITTVQNVIDQINASKDFTASLDDSGRFVISTNSASGSSISISSGSTNYSCVIGLTQGTLGGNASFNSGSKDIFSSLKGSTTGLSPSSRFSSGDFSVSVTSQDGSSLSQSFTLSGNESLSDIASLISNSSLGISAIIDSSDNSLILKAKSAGQYTISLQDGTSDFAEITGFSKYGAQASPSVSGSLSTLTSSMSVQNALSLGFSSGDFSISLKDSNGNICASQIFNISSVDSIDSIISKINSSSLNISASINNQGLLVLSVNSCDQALSISVNKGSSDFTNKLGFTQGGSSSASYSQGQNSSRSSLSSLSLNSQLSDSLSSLGISSGSFIINSASVFVSDSDSIASLLLKINSAFDSSDKNGVTAEFINNKIVLTSNFPSPDSSISIESGSSNISDILGFTINSKLNSAAQSLGSNSKFSINGQLHESDSNSISLDSSGNLIDNNSSAEAIRFTIKDIGSGTVDIGKQSLNYAYNLLNSFTNKFNNSMALSQNPSLASDPQFINLLNSIHSNLSDSVGIYKQLSKELADIGITVASSSYSSSQAPKLSISLNKDKFINSFLNNPDKILALLVGDDSKPIDQSKAGAFTKLQYTLSNSISDFISPSIKNLESQAKNLSFQLANASSELLNAKSSLAFDNSSQLNNPANLNDYLAQLEAQYISVNNLIDKMKNQYNQSVSRLVLNGR